VSDRRVVVLTESQFGFSPAKTAIGVIRYGSDEIVAALDSSQACRNVAEFLRGHEIPFVATLEEAFACDSRPNALLIGIAPIGGRLPDSWRVLILDAIAARLDVHSGLHQFLGDDPEFAAAAASTGVRLIDYRRSPERMETAVGRRHAPGKRVILTIGTADRSGRASGAPNVLLSTVCRFTHFPDAGLMTQWRVPDAGGDWQWMV
jgi:uncharacterized NAD-dependent epimerase/dehydratase family protein